VEVDNYCGGIIKGSGNERCCGHLSNACAEDTKGGAQRKSFVPCGDQVLSENCLGAGSIPEDTVTQMLGVSKPSNLWLTYFLSLTTVHLRDRQTEVNDSSGLASTRSE
jgi:hypothetical protein